MTFRALLTCLAIASGQPALALSCLPPSVAGAFRYADEHPAPFVMAVGRLTPVPGQRLPPVPDNPSDRQGYSLQTTFDGQLATRSGFDSPARLDVRVDVRCLGPWCGAAPSGEQLMFLEQTDEGYRLDAGPCSMLALAAEQEFRAQALSCLNGGPCD